MALGFKFFTSSDAGAPLLTPQVGSLINVLDWALDTTDSVNGWEIAFTAANKRVYRSRYGIRDFFRVDDGGGAGNALVRAYESMSDVDTGVDPYPLIAQAALVNGKQSHTFTATGALPVDYYGIKTARFLMLVRPARRSPELPTSAADIFIMGEFPKTENAGADPHLSLISMHNTASAPGDSQSPFSTVAAVSGTLSILGALGAANPSAVTVCVRRNRSGSVKAMPARLGLLANNTIFLLNTTLTDGEPLVLQPVYVSTADASNTDIMRHLRGFLPGLYFCLKNLDSSWLKGDTFTDSQGRPYVYLRTNSASVNTGPALVLGMTDEHGAV